MKKIILYLILLCISIIVACKTYNFRTNYNDANILIHDSAINQTKLFLKTHLKNGDIIILKDTWKIDTISNKVTGYGTRYDFNRKKTYEGIIYIPIDSVAIFETNKKLDNSETSRIAAITILSSVDVTLGIMCLTNPKACFGSCPTFYINENDNFHYADAEGFSNAIAPSLEYADIDALNNSSLTTRDFSLTMKNEALETHCLNEVKLLAYPRKKNERVYQTRTNDFYLCKNKYELSESKSNKEDNTLLLQKEDRKERFSTSDVNNLSSKRRDLFKFQFS